MKPHSASLARDLGLARDLSLGKAALATAFLAEGQTADAFAEVLAVLSGARKSTSPQPRRDEDAVEQEDTPRTKRPQPTQPRTAPFLDTDGKSGPSPAPIKPPVTPDVDLVKRHVEPSMAFRGDDARWLPKGDMPPQRPIHFPLITSNTFAAILGALGRQPSQTSTLDTARLVDAFARRKPMKRLPTKIRYGLGSEVVVIRDLGPGMIPFQPDIDDFLDRTRRQLGSEKVRDDVYIDAEGSLIGVDTIGPNSTVVIVSDLQGFARRYAYGHTKRDDWLDLAERIVATQSRAVVLSPGTSAGHVPAPAFPDLFDGRRPLVAPIIPWDTSLTARHAATYVKRERVAVHRRPARDIGESGSSAYRLLRLLTLAQDVDHWTLRTLRLVLSAPRLVAQKYEFERDSHSPRHGKESDKLEASDPRAGAFHEHEVWTSAYLAYRGDVGTLSGKVDELREAAPIDVGPNWDEVVRFALDALLRVRAGRGLIQLVGDRRRWAKSPDRPDREAADEELRESQFVAEAIARLDGSTRRVGQIDRNLRINPVVPADAGTRTPHLTLRKDREFLIVGLDTPRADVSIPLPRGFNLEGGSVELWPVENADRPVITRPLWPVPQFIHLALDKEQPLRTVIVRLGSQVVSINLDASLAELKPLFTRAIKEEDVSPSIKNMRRPYSRYQKSLRFEGNEIVCRERKYDPLGLRHAGEGPPVAEPDKVPEDFQSLSRGPLGIWLQKDDRGLYVQRVAGSGEISGIDLPNLPSRDRPYAASGQDGHVVAFNNNHVWSVTSKESNATVWTWDVAGVQGLNLAAASAAGALLVDSDSPFKRPGSKKQISRAHFFPAQPESAQAVEDRSDGNANSSRVISVVLPGDPDEIAMNDAGFIAVRAGSTLFLYEPLARLGAGQSGMGANMKAASEGADKPALTAQLQKASYKRTWFPTKDYDARSVIEGMISGEDGSLGRIFRAMRRNVRVSARDVEITTGLSPEQAQLIADIFALDAAAIRASTVSVDFQLPVSGITPLQLACTHQEPGDLVPALLERGADPNRGDRFGRTPLYSASYCLDTGQTLTRLLDAGADASLTGDLDGEAVGPLAAALYRDAKDAHSAANAPPREVVERLLDGGADAKAFSAQGGQTSLMFAAMRGDEDLFRRILTLDNKRLNHISAMGWFALRYAAWTGNEGVARILLENGADPELAGESRHTALITAAQNGHAEIVALLLRYRANVEGTDGGRPGTPLNPLEYAINQSLGSAKPEQAAAVVRVLAEAGANPDKEPFPFRNLVLSNSIDQRVLLAVEAFAQAGRPLGLLETIKHHGSIGLRGERLQRLLQLPIDLKARDAAGVRLVHLLAILWSPEKAEKDAAVVDPFALLRERGASLEALDDHGWSALHYAAAAGKVEGARALLRLAPALADSRREQGLSPADLAELFGHHELAGELGGVTASNEPLPPPRVPLAATMARLTFLASDAVWQTHVPMPPARRAAGGKVDVKTPLPASLSTWTSVLTREAPLPYKSGRKLRETWWRRADDVVGVSGTVLNADGTEIFDIDGKSPHIHEMNAKDPPAMDTPAGALRYLKFFCQAVHGEEGHFAVLETNEVFQSHMGRVVSEETASPEHKNPAISAEDEGAWRITTNIRYGDAIFEADFRILPAGMIEMVSDRPVTEPAAGEGFGNDSDRIFFYAKS